MCGWIAAPIRVTAIGAHPRCNCWSNCPDPTGPQPFLEVIVDKSSYVCNGFWSCLHFECRTQFFKVLFCFFFFFLNTLLCHLIAQIMTQIPDMKLFRGHDFGSFYFYWQGSPPFVLSPSCHQPIRAARDEEQSHCVCHNLDATLCWVPPSTPCFT